MPRTEREVSYEAFYFKAKFVPLQQIKNKHQITLYEIQNHRFRP